jgi:hypothetical protein
VTTTLIISLGVIVITQHYLGTTSWPILTNNAWYLFVISDSQIFVSRDQKIKKIWCARRARVYFPHIANKWISYFSAKIHRKYPKLQNLKIMLYYLHNIVYMVQLSMPDFSSPASIQTDLDKFLTFFQESFRIFQKILKPILKNLKSEYAILCSN